MWWASVRMDSGEKEHHQNDSHSGQYGILEQHILHLLCPLCCRGHPQAHPSCSGQTAPRPTAQLCWSFRAKEWEIWNCGGFFFMEANSKENWQNQHGDSQLTTLLMAHKCLWETEMLFWVVLSPEILVTQTSQMTSLKYIKKKKSAGSVEVATECLWMFSTI